MNKFGNSGGTTLAYDARQGVNYVKLTNNNKLTFGKGRKPLFGLKTINFTEDT